MENNAAVTIDINENMSSILVQSKGCGADVRINTGSNVALLKDLVIEILKTSAAIPS
jgi:hypothetical protein